MSTLLQTLPSTLAPVAPTAPAFADVGVIFLVPDQWKSLPQSRHQVALRLARYFRVLWLDDVPTATGIRLEQQRAAGVGGDLSSAPLTVHRLATLERLFNGSSLMRRALLRRRLRHARRALRAAGCHRIVLYVWRPTYVTALDAIKVDHIVYHIDDEYSFSRDEQAFGMAEGQLLERADCVFVHSPGLLARKGAINDNTVFAPNGVDFTAYATPVSEPRDLAAVGGPRLGYCGVIKEHLDIGLLHAIAEARPAWAIVLVGPVGNLGDKHAAFEALRALPNVHLLGRSTLEELPAYVQHFDIAMMCYEVNGYTNCIYPLKLHEYLAAGRPVVSTPIRTALDFDGTITIAAGAEAWIEAIDAILSDAIGDPIAATRGRETAARHDWDFIVARIALELSKLLGEDYADACRAFQREICPDGIFEGDAATPGSG